MAIDLNKYTQKAQEAILASQTLATEYNHAQIEPEHLLLALLQQSDGVVPQVVDRLGVRPPVLIRELETLLANRPKVYGGAQVGLSRAVSDIFIRAEREAGPLAPPPDDPALGLHRRGQRASLAADRDPGAHGPVLGEPDDAQPARAEVRHADRHGRVPADGRESRRRLDEIGRAHV